MLVPGFELRTFIQKGKLFIAKGLFSLRTECVALARTNARSDHVVLDFLVLLYQDKRTEENMSTN